MSERKRTGGWDGGEDNVREEAQEDFRRKIKRLDVKGERTREGRGERAGVASACSGAYRRRNFYPGELLVLSS